MTVLETHISGGGVCWLYVHVGHSLEQDRVPVLMLMYVLSCLLLWNQFLQALKVMSLQTLSEAKVHSDSNKTSPFPASRPAQRHSAWSSLGNGEC